MADLIDDALLRPGRFDTRIGVAAPDEAVRRGTLRIRTRDVPLGDDGDLDDAARRMDGYVGADFEAAVVKRRPRPFAMVREASWYVRAITSGEEATVEEIAVTIDYFEQALDSVDIDGLRFVWVEGGGDAGSASRWVGARTPASASERLRDVGRYTPTRPSDAIRPSYGPVLDP